MTILNEIFKKMVLFSTVFLCCNNLYADVTMNDSAENLLGAKITTLIPFNNPMTRPAYAYFQIGMTGTPQVFDSKSFHIDDYSHLKIKEGDILYFVTVEIKPWIKDEHLSTTRFSKDVLLPQGNTYTIQNTSSRIYNNGLYMLTTGDLSTPDSGVVKEIAYKSPVLHIFIWKGRVFNHKCTNKDSELVKEKLCKGRKYVLALDGVNGDLSIEEVVTVLKPIVSIDLDTIPKMIIPGNKN